MGILLVLILSGWLGYKSLTKKLETKLKEGLTEAGFTYSYDAIHWHIFPPGVSLDNLRLFSTKDSTILSLRLAHAKVSYQLGDIMDGKMQNPSNISIRNGYVHLQPDSLSTLSKSKKPKQPEDWKIREINLRDVDIALGNSKKTSFHVQLLSGSLAGKYAGKKVRYEVVKEPIKFTLTKFHMDTLFKFHGFDADFLQYDMATQQIHAKNARIIPLVNRSYLEQHVSNVALHANLTLPEMKMRGVEWTYDQKLYLRARKIELFGPVFNAHQNKEKPLRPGERPMPPWVDGLAIKFRVDTVQVMNATLTYAFMPANDPKQAQVVLDKWDMYWLDYGNDSLRPKSFSAKGKIRWMKSIWMYGTVTFPYDDPKHSFRMEGYFEPGDFGVLNSVICPIDGFIFESGRCNKFKFSLSGDEDHIRGKVWVEFEDVKIAFCADAPPKAPKEKNAKQEARDVKQDAKQGARDVKQDAKQGARDVKQDAKQEARDAKPKSNKNDAKADQSKGNNNVTKSNDDQSENDKPKNDKPDSHALKNFIANTIVVRTSTHGKVREVEINVERNKQQSVFSLWMKGLMTGLKGGLTR